ncbi:hypothetical protein F5887DRAFT_873981 [Amanita rubescens]|nr:hypothetical protein F5887DRAFT_873981 [Amanita rubescens]
MQPLLKCLLLSLSLPCLAIPLSDSTQSQSSSSPINSPITTVRPIFSTPTSFGTTTTDSPIVIQLTASPTTAVCTTTVTITSWADVSWKAPNHYSDLSPYNITGFPVGQHNLAVVTSIPSTTFKVDDLAQISNGTDTQDTDNSTSMLQILYPAHSINPGTKPQGGAEFYAIPLNITDAQNVTLTYSVFFPADFDYVLAGKLPGLYGGHGGCSGGYDATDCFSTRLMWRKGGLGELYLYAPRDKQTKALCADPQSVCDADYGLSIGRGAYTWAAGRWTTVSQTVSLNTPGRPDGSFTLDVNEIRVIDRHDIFYRNVPSCFDSENSSELARNAITFFGGHEDKYATPRDQFVWFKDFQITYHS